MTPPGTGLPTTRQDHPQTTRKPDWPAQLRLQRHQPRETLPTAPVHPRDRFPQEIAVLQIRLTKSAKLNLKMWERFLGHYNGVTMFLPDGHRTQNDLGIQVATTLWAGWR